MATMEASSKSSRRNLNRGCKRKITYAELDDHVEEMLEGGRVILDDDDGDEVFKRASVKKRKTRKDHKSTTSKKAEGPSRRRATAMTDVATQKKQSSKKTDKGKMKHAKEVSYLRKKDIDSIVGVLKKVELVPIKNFVLEFLKKERHIEQNDRRKRILEDLKNSEAMDKLVRQLYSKCISLLKAGI